MLVEVQAPNKVPDGMFGKFRLFLGGAIDMGNAEDWQRKMINDLAGEDVLILNPRRDDFDVSQEQSKDNPYFRAQVEWELLQQHTADLCVYYFPASSVCRITFMELGLFCRYKEHVILCEEGFDRKGNVDVTCEAFGFNQVEDYETLLAFVRDEIHK